MENENQEQKNIPPIQLKQTSLEPLNNLIKSPLFMISGLVIIICIIFISINISKKKRTTEQSTILPTQTVIYPTEIPKKINPTTDPTEVWKTYTNDKFNFLFKYPENLFKYFEILSETSDSANLEFATDQISGGRPELFTTININKDPRTLKEYIEMYKSFYEDIKEQSEIIDGNSASRIIRYPAKLEVPMVYSDSIYFKKNLFIYSIRMVSENKDLLEKNKLIFNQILSTFKFNEKTVINLKRIGYIKSITPN